VFKFEPTNGTDENLALFWSHLSSIDPTLTELLKTNIPTLIPLPTTDKDKSDKRVSINGKISAALDLLAEPEQGDV
jgi:hypothetical protein